MKVNLVNYEMDFANGILSKFAWRMGEELEKLGIKHSITDAPDGTFDVNHHLMFGRYRHVSSINTVLVTHIDSERKFQQLSEAMRTADKGVCMSKDTMDAMITRGIQKQKLTFVLPAHDNDTVPIPIAILTDVKVDGRKREKMVYELAKYIDLKRFIFRIMGQDWDIEGLRKLGFQVEYHPSFEREAYAHILRDSKYYLYTGLDEGSMGTVDAKRAGLKTIATPQGFHIELGLDHPFMTQEELNKIFLEIQKPALPDWTWQNYTKNHVAIWEKLIAQR